MAITNLSPLLIAVICDVFTEHIIDSFCVRLCLLSFVGSSAVSDDGDCSNLGVRSAF